MSDHDHAKKQGSKAAPSQKPGLNVEQQIPESLDEIMRAIAAPSYETLTPKVVMQLQRSHGNQFVLGLLDRAPAAQQSALPPVPGRHAPQQVVQRDDEDEPLLGGGGGGMDMAPLNQEEEPQQLTGNPFLDLPEPSPDELSQGPNPFEEMDDQTTLDPKGQNPNIKTGKTGHTGKQGQITDTAMVGYSAYSTGKNVNKLAKGIQSGTFDDKIDANEQSSLAKSFNATSTKLSQQLEVVGSNKAIADTYIGALKDTQELYDKIISIAGKGIPIVGAVVSVGFAAKGAWDSWNTYSTWKGAAKEAVQVLTPNTDKDTTEKSPLLKDTGGKTSATYAQAKSLRALVSKLFNFAISVAKAMGEIAALFTAGLGELASLSASLIKAVSTGGRWLKALYKMAKNTKGKNREKHANIVMEAADAGDETMLDTLVKLDLTSDKWMIKLAAKLGTVYDPKTDGQGWFAEKKGKAVKFASSKATDYAGKAKDIGKDLGQYGSSKLAQFGSNKIKEQFIEGATTQTMEVLLNKPKTADEMHTYLQELKVVGMYQDFAKEVMSSMKSQ